MLLCPGRSRLAYSRNRSSGTVLAPPDGNFKTADPVQGKALEPTFEAGDRGAHRTRQIAFGRRLKDTENQLVESILAKWQLLNQK